MGAAETLRVRMPLGSLLYDRFPRLLAPGGERLDWSAIGGLAAQDASDPFRRRSIRDGAQTGVPSLLRQRCGEDEQAGDSQHSAHPSG